MDLQIGLILVIGIYQLTYMRIAPHAALAETVEVAKDLNKTWATALINGLLRNYQRQALQLKDGIQSQEAEASHPQWLITALKKSWPQQWQKIIEANNSHPPLTLRVNQLKTTRTAYLKKLADVGIAASPLNINETTLILDKPMDVKILPGFAEGLVSVQDVGAQCAATLLGVEAHHRVLDACAAPGGKTTHILELQPHLKELVAIDHDEHRVQQIQNNLKRLNLSASVFTCDVNLVNTWWDGIPFDRILLDVPCSALGVIRRHPDIKIRRRATDIAKFSAQQTQLLMNLWPLLKPGGLLVYATCSVLPAENEDIIACCIKRFSDMRPKRRKQSWGEQCQYGWQILPGQNNSDGFYYACLEKMSL